LLVRH